MSEDRKTSPLDPIWLTEKAVKALRSGQLEEAAQYLTVAKSQLMDNIKSGDKLPLRRMTSEDIKMH
tara:strand:+ start:188 stop:385 length:198 start_codon:yes stop_codon:yes gene_type:complete